MARYTPSSKVDCLVLKPTSLIAFALSVLILPVAFGQSTPRSMDGANPERTNLYEGPIVPRPGQKLWESEKLFEIQWLTIPLNGGPPVDFSRGVPPFKLELPDWMGDTDFNYSPPLVQAGVAYFSLFEGDGHLIAVDLATGKLKWKTTRAKEHFSFPSLSAGLLLVGTGKTLHAINVNTQTELWKYDASDVIPTRMSPMLVNGVVYFGTKDGNLYAVDAAKGKEKWTFKTGNAGDWHSFVLGNGILYCTQTTGFVYAVDLAKPQKLWSYQHPSGAWYPAFAYNTLFFLDRNGVINALDPSTGKPRPEFRKRHQASTKLAISDGKIFFGGWDTGSVFAVDAITGEQVWKFQLSQPYFHCSIPAIVGDTVYLTCSNKQIYALDAKSGKKTWSSEVKLEMMSAPVIAAGVLYFIADDGKVHALK